MTSNIPNQLVPNAPSLLGVSWAAQATVTGGGFTDLSSALYGVIDMCF